MTNQPGPEAAPPSFVCQFCSWDSRWPNDRQGCPLCYRERLKRGRPADPPRVVTEDDGSPD
jgi:hypothetical protein